MKTSNFWRSLFFSALAVAAFGACSDDDDTSDFDAVIKVDDKKETTVGVAAAGGETQAVAVTSAGAWTLAFDADQEWCFPNVTSGKGGTTELVFSVDPLPEGVSERSATAVLSSQGRIFEVEYTVTARVTVRQSESGSTIPTTNVASIREKLVAMNPTSTQTDVTEEIAANALTGIVVSNPDGKNTGSTWNISVQDAVAAKNSGLVISSSKFASNTYAPGTCVTVALTGAKVQSYNGLLQLSIADAAVEAIKTVSGEAPEPIAIVPDDLLDYESMLVKIENCYPTAGYGAGWNTSTNKGNVNFITTDGQTFICRTGSSAAFKDSAIPEKMGALIGIAGRYNNDKQLSPRTAADIRLTEEIPAPEYTPATIDQITKAGNYKVENATVIATYAAGFLMQDATGIMLVYPGTTENPATIPAVDKVVTVEGRVSAYGGVLQFGQGSTVTETGTGTAPTPPQPVEITADNVADFVNSPKVTYVKMTGMLTKTVSGSSTYYNLAFTFETSFAGSITVPGADSKFNIDSYDGKLIDLTGWFVNNPDGTSYLSVVATDIKENTTTPTLTFTTKPQPFAGKDPVAQPIGFKTNNVPDNTLVLFSFAGGADSKFQVDSQDGSSVTISPKGNNDSDAAYTDTLIATLDGKTLAELPVKQSEILTGNDTKGTFTSMNNMLPTSDSSDDGYYAQKAKVNGSSTEVNILKFGTSSKAGAFTTGAVGVSGNKKLSFYAAAWNGKSATLYVRINNGGSVTPGSVALTGNTGVANSSPYTITLNDDTDYFTFDVTGLTENSTITFSTNSGFTAAGDKSTGRAIVLGIQIY